MIKKSPDSNLKDSPILLFDGVCNLCNESVQFIIKHDKPAQFRFTALQSEVGQSILRKYQLPTDSLSTLVLIYNDISYTQSSAALEILKLLGFPWAIFYAFTIVPKSIRDRIYSWISSNRYRWFGKQESCMVPTPELSSRFLQ